jgi:hypothetical protein
MFTLGLHSGARYLASNAADRGNDRLLRASRWTSR